jgi:hypothetical protein
LPHSGTGITYDRLGHTDETSIVDCLRNQRDDDDVDDGEDSVWYREQIGHRSREPKATEGDLKIARDRDSRKIERKRDEV